MIYRIGAVLSLWTLLSVMWIANFPPSEVGQSVYIKILWLLIAIAALIVVAKLPSIFPGWVLASTSILVDILREVTAEPAILGDVVVSGLRVFALPLLFWGFWEASNALDERKNFRRFVDALPLGVAIYRNGKFVYTNAVASDCPIDHLRSVAEATLKDGTATGEVKIRGKVFEVRGVRADLAGRQTAVLTLRDVTSEKLTFLNYTIMREVERADIRTAAEKFLELLGEVVDFEVGGVFLRVGDKGELIPITAMESLEGDELVISHGVGGFEVVVALKTEERNSELVGKIVESFAVAIRDYVLVQQLKKNVDAFSTLVDRIRNPLAAIAGLAEMKCGDDVAEKIWEQVERITEAVKEIEERWGESEAWTFFGGGGEFDLRFCLICTPEWITERAELEVGVTA